MGNWSSNERRNSKIGLDHTVAENAAVAAQAALGPPESRPALATNCKGSHPPTCLKNYSLAY